MKKHLIAAAVAAAVAVPAAAQVTVYGIVDLGYSQVDNEVMTNSVSRETKRQNTGNGDGMLSTSRLGFRGSEDLGGGLKADFRLEYDLTDVGTGANTFGARYSFVGLSGGFGTVRLGRQESSMHSVVVGASAGYANNMPGTLYSDGSTPALSNNGATVRPHTVWTDRAVTYISPSLSGFTVELQAANSSTKDGTVAGVAEGEVFAGSLKYASGPLSVGFSALRNETKAGANETEREELAIGGSYKFGMATVFAMHTSNEIQNAVTGVNTQDRSAFEIGARVPLGAGTEAWISTFSGDDDVANATRDHEGWQLGVKRDLSKRTTIYAIYGAQENEGTGTLAGNGTETDGFGFGVRHSF